MAYLFHHRAASLGRLTIRLGVFGTLLGLVIPLAVTSVITKLQYKKADSYGAKQLKGLLGYLQHRREAPVFADLPRGGRRWVDCGLGGTFKAIQANCERLRSDHVLAFTWVIAPNPDCIALLDPRHHQRFVSELTERTLDSFFEARGMPTPEYAYIHHTRETEDATAPGRLHPHSHIVLAGSYEDHLSGQRQPYYMNKSRTKGEDHPDLLWQTAQAEMGQLLERYVGQDWAKHLEQLVAEREQAAQAIQEQAIQERLAELVHVADSATLQQAAPVPDCWGESEDGLLWRGWLVMRSTASDQHMIGVHWQADDLLAGAEDNFELLLTDLDAKEAALYQRELRNALSQEPGRGIAFVRSMAEAFQPDIPPPE